MKKGEGPKKSGADNKTCAFQNVMCHISEDCMETTEKRTL